jgi:hypothetical protein
MNKSSLLGFIVVLIYISIGCNNSDIYRELTGGYAYRDEGGEMKQILCGVNYKNEIYGKVLSYDYNRKFIIVSQEPSLEDYIGMLSFYLRDDTVKYPTNDKDVLLKSEQEADSLIHSDSFYKSIFRNDINYWIIQITNDSLIGPLTKSEFEATRKELQIPDKLKLD